MWGKQKKPKHVQKEKLAMFDEENVCHGPDLPDPLPDVCLGVYCFEAIKCHPEGLQLMTESRSGRTITSEEFLQLAVNFAGGLKSLGIEPGDVVALIGVNAININAAALGCMLVGAIWAGVDPTLKAFELQHIIKLYEPKLLVTDTEIVPALKEAICNLEVEIQMITLQENDCELSSFDSILADLSVDEFEPTVVDVEDVVMIVGSSGTTGLPKGVALTHSNFHFQIVLIEPVCKMLGNRNYLHTSHFFWVSGIILLFASMTFGVKRILVENVIPEEVMHAVSEHKANMGLLAPSLLDAIVNHPEIGNYDMTPLIGVICAGSPLKQSTVEKAKEVLGQHLLMAQTYGMTEVGGSFLTVRPDFDIYCVGSPHYGTKIRVVDTETGENLPYGQEGEFLCYSLGLMKGYWNNPEATAEVVDEDGWFHSGDIGYINAEGKVYITGRIKELLKIDNHQISPAEIELLISSVPGVADVGVSAVKSSEVNIDLMGLVVRESVSQVTEEEVIKCVNENLSEFKHLKAGVCFVDAIPRTTTGKIKRRLLQELADTLYMGDTNFIL